MLTARSEFLIGCETLMLNFLFWNVNNKPISQLVAELVLQHGIDVVALAEHGKIDPEMLLKDLNRDGVEYYSASKSPRTVAFTKFKPQYVKRVFKDNYLLIHSLTLPARTDILFGMVHLPSKLYQSEYDQSDLATRYPRIIEEVEGSARHSRTILVGDFNMNPFERGMAGSETFHSVMDRSIAGRQSRVVRGMERRYFYNPMWSKMGDLSEGPPGTYYYGGSTPLMYFWNTFDQILIRPSLIDKFVSEQLQVVTEVNGQSLLNRMGRPNKNSGSDHLPLMFSLDV